MARMRRSSVVDAPTAAPHTLVSMADTLIWDATGVEIHQVVVGPVDNNVLVLRCTETGDAVLLDAANEHERLLELCQRLGVRRVLETHGHWDHIQAVPAAARRRLLGGRHRRRTPPCSPPTTRCIEDDVGDRGGPPAAAHDPHPGPHARARCASCSRATRSSSAATRCSPAAPGNTTFEGGDFPTIIESVDRRLFTLPADTIVLPGHGDRTTIGAERPHLQEWIDRGW